MNTDTDMQQRVYTARVYRAHNGVSARLSPRHQAGKQGSGHFGGAHGAGPVREPASRECLSTPPGGPSPSPGGSQRPRGPAKMHHGEAARHKSGGDALQTRKTRGRARTPFSLFRALGRPPAMRSLSAANAEAFIRAAKSPSATGSDRLPTASRYLSSANKARVERSRWSLSGVKQVLFPGPGRGH